MRGVPQGTRLDAAASKSASLKKQVVRTPRCSRADAPVQPCWMETGWVPEFGLNVEFAVAFSFWQISEHKGGLVQATLPAEYLVRL